ncbi:alpha/beta fold hydrolase [Paenibacillus dendritiformis]|uniref:alpha/beta fold hydrolase n=1 Tax=Paenibacillus dendritiformis TaxID=130049 RepID=UPI00387E02EA
MGELIPVRGKNLYVEHWGQAHQEALLYLHGGPGASCLDFSVYQAKELSKRIRVISMDQRGVLRSDPIEEDEPFGLDDLIRDCEVLDYFQNHAPNGRVIRFENSAHMPRLEEPQKYTKVILDFMFQ